MSSRIDFAAITLIIVLASGAAACSTISSKRPDGKHWTSDNLNVTTDNSYCYEDGEANCAKYRQREGETQMALSVRCVAD